jgi:hypothetical protein
VIRGSTCPYPSLFSSFSFLPFLEIKANLPAECSYSSGKVWASLRILLADTAPWMSDSLCFNLYRQQYEKHVSSVDSVTTWRLRWRPSWTLLSTHWRGWVVQAVSAGLVAVAHSNGGAHRVAGRGPPLLGWRQTFILWLPCLGGLSNFNTGKIWITLFYRASPPIELN